MKIKNVKVGRKPKREMEFPINISESELELIQDFSTAPTNATSDRSVYFAPHETFQVEVVDGRDISVQLGASKISFQGLALVCYRKIQCSNEDCLKRKWANEFHWNRRGIEGPFKEFWGKRDCWCKVCRSKKKARDRRQRAKAMRRREGTNTVDLTKFTVIENFETWESEKQQRAYRDLLDRVYFRMIKE